MTERAFTMLHVKARDYAFLGAGLALGLIPAVLLSQRAPVPDKPVVVSEEVPAPLPMPDTIRPGGNIYLAGQVRTQGVVTIRPDENVTVSQAIALGGGVANKGDAQEIQLQRRRADGTSETIPVDLRISNSGYVNDPAVQPGDLINVPEKSERF